MRAVLLTLALLTSFGASAEPPQAAPDGEVREEGPDSGPVKHSDDSVKPSEDRAESAPDEVVKQSAPTVKRSRVEVRRDASGMRLVVDGRDFMVFGMNWGYTPIGENYRYDLWSKPDAFITAVLDRDMGMLSAMGVNAIRLFSEIPPRWVRYIYERYGIHTAINPLMGRYGFLIDGAYVSPVDYSDPVFRKAVLADLDRIVALYRDVPGVLMYLLGNENNYGLEWPSAEIDALPRGERERARATHLYSLFGEAVARIKASDPDHPVGLANGDLQYLDLIASLVVPRGLDFMGSNVYRGASSGDLFLRVRDELGLPFVYTEFGADAFDAKRHREDDLAQARYLVSQWREIYQQSAGHSGVGNAIGGFVFQWADGWWKYRQETNLDVHDDNASWPNGGYPEDFVEGRNNMNEEWFGICAIGPNDASGLIELLPRTAYHALRAGFALDPYAEATTAAAIDAHWNGLPLDAFADRYLAKKTASELGTLGRVRLRDLRIDLRTYATGGYHLDDVAREDDRFDHQETFLVDLEARPVDTVRTRLALHVLGHVADNPIDEIRNEARGRSRTVLDAEGKRLVLDDLERLKVHAAEVSWEEEDFLLEAFYRVGHYHWGYEGDVFGLYPEAHYGAAIDRYNASAPVGMAFTGKGDLSGLRLAFGPELWWGANPALLAAFKHDFGPVTASLVHHEDVGTAARVVSSNAVPERTNRRTSLSFATTLGILKIELSGLMSGTPRLGETFEDVVPVGEGEPSYAGSGYLVTRDQIEFPDTLGGRVKLMASTGPIHTYLQGSYRGLVNDGGADPVITYTGWSLKESGRGNHWALSGGAAVQLGDFQVAPNLLYQVPLVGPMPSITERYDLETNTYLPAMKPRSILAGPFAVLDNREVLGLELMLTYDPTPGTWLWAWDNEIVEDASFAASLDLTYRHQPTSRDASVGFTSDGQVFAFPGAPPPADLFEAAARILANPGAGVRLASRLWAGQAQARGDDPRTVLRFGADMRLVWDRAVFEAFAKFGDYGPYDYHRDFNMTYPLQVMADISWAAGPPAWLGRLFTRFGIRGELRTLDANSNRYVPPESGQRGLEWEVMTYLQTTLGGAP